MGAGRKEGRGGRANRSSLLRDGSTLSDGLFSTSEVDLDKSEILADPWFWREADIP